MPGGSTGAAGGTRKAVAEGRADALSPTTARDVRTRYACTRAHASRNTKAASQAASSPIMERAMSHFGIDHRSILRLGAAVAMDRILPSGFCRDDEFRFVSILNSDCAESASVARFRFAGGDLLIRPFRPGVGASPAMFRIQHSGQARRGWQLARGRKILRSNSRILGDERAAVLRRPSSGSGCPPRGST